MYSDVFIDGFSKLGTRLISLINEKEKDGLLPEAMKNAYGCNNLFTFQMQYESLKAISVCFLDKNELEKWISRFRDSIFESHEEVLIVMAGNLPLVGFHDLLSVMASGKKALVKMSSSDSVLLPFIVDCLFKIDDFWCSRIRFVNDLPDNPDALIATGNDSTAAFFNNKYSSAYKLVRGSKSSIAVLGGSENEQDISLLAKDLFLYFGLGCRSVSTLLVPVGYDTEGLVFKLGKKTGILQGSKSYSNSYKYQKALSLMNGERVSDGGLFLLKKESGFPPPMSVVSFVEYQGKEGLSSFLDVNEYGIQCVVNHLYKGKLVKFGESQYPRLDDYADGVNSLAFLLKMF